jgi:hypothetical protein
MVCFCLPVDKDVLTVVEKLTIATHRTKFIPTLKIGAPLRKKPNEMDKNEKLAPKLRTSMGV